MAFPTIYSPIDRLLYYFSYLITVQRFEKKAQKH